MWSSACCVVAFSTAIVLTFYQIPIEAMANLARILIRFIVLNPIVSWIAFRLLFTNTFFFAWCEEDYRVAPHCTFGVKLNLHKFYPDFSILEQILFHDAPETGTKLTLNIGCPIFFEISASFAVPVFRRLGKFRTVMGLMNTTFASSARDMQSLGNCVYDRQAWQHPDG